MNEVHGHEESKQEGQQQTHHDSMRQAILNSIKSGDVSRKPRWQFILQAVFTAIGVVLVLLAAVYLASAVFFALRVDGSWFLPTTLGFAGVSPFLRSLPWVLLILAIIFILLLYALVKRYAFAYGRPFLYSALAVVVVVTASAVLVGFTSFHKGIFQSARDGHVPFGTSPLFENFGQQPHDVTIGIIRSITADNWIISTHDGTLYTIAITGNIPVPQHAQVGDEVVVLGSRDDNMITAEAIRPIEHGYGGMDDMDEPGTSSPAPTGNSQGLMIPAAPYQQAQPTY